MPQTDILIKVRNLSKVYRPSATVETLALQALDLDLSAGEFLAVTGQSGSGKSTLLNLLALIDEPTTGTIEVAGIDVTQISESQRVAFRLHTVSMVFQFFNLIESYTALENIAFQLLLQGEGLGTARQKAKDMLQFLGLNDKQNTYPKDLSGGQQQRVAVGRALAKDSLFILADEPTAHLDAKNGQALIDLLRKVNQEFKRTVILVSHEISHANQADRVIKLQDGKLVA